MLQNTKRIIGLILMLALMITSLAVVSIGTSAADETETWVKTDVADIKADDVVVITWTNSQGTYAMSNDKGSSAAPTAVSVNVDGDNLSGTISENIKWNITNNDGTLTIYPNGNTSNWLYCTNSNNGVRVGTGTDNAFTITSDYLYNDKSSNTDRYLGVYNSQDVRCYTSINTNISGQTLAFYVLNTGSSSGGGTGEPDCEHEWTEATCTAPKTCSKCGATEGEALDHSYDEGVETTPATCTTAGVKTYTCGTCGETKTEDIAALGHTFAGGLCSVCGAAQPTNVTFEFGENGSESHTDGSSASSYSETNGDYTLKFDTLSKVYTGARDAKGNSCIKLGTSSAVASFSFTAPDDVKYVVIHVAQYKANATKVVVNDTEYTITTASNNGEYTSIIVDVSTNKTVTLSTVSSNNRAMINAIDYYFDCPHSWVDADCDTAKTCSICGATEGEALGHTPGAEADCTTAQICTVCKATIVEALGHNYENNVCTRCGVSDHVHDYKIVVTDPTCAAGGFTTHTCSICGSNYVDNELSPVSHKDEDNDYLCDYSCGTVLAPEANSILTIEQAIALGQVHAHNTYTSNKYYVTGVISEVYNTTYGNMYIVDANENKLTIYGTYNADGSSKYDAMTVKPVAGDTVTIYGVVGQYNGTSQIKNGWITEHIVPECDHEDADGDYLCDNTCGKVLAPAADGVLSIVEANKLGVAHAHNNFTSDKYYVTGIVTEIVGTEYGNMYIKDAEGNTLYIYGYYSMDGSTRFDAMETKPVVGDEVTVYGIIGQYNGTAQMKNAWQDELVQHTHDWSEATCTVPATCSICGATDGEALGHVYFYPCDPVCMICYEITNPDATHNVVHVEAVAATCYENGNIEYWYCSDCGATWADEAQTQVTNQMNIVVPMAHKPATHVAAVAPTCYENGNIEYWYCEACGQAWLDEACTLNTNLMAVVLPMAHAEATHVAAKDATCTELGNIEYWYCEACGQAWLDADCTLNTNLKAVVLPMADHSYTDGVCGTCGAEDPDYVVYVAQVGDVKYTDLQEAIKAAAPAGTVELLCDVTVEEWIMFAEKLNISNGDIITLNINGLTINGNGHTLTINSIESAGNGGRLFYDAENLNINNLTIKYADGLSGGIGLQSGTLNGVTFDGGVYGVLPGAGDVTIEGCTFKTNGTAIYFEEERDNLVVTGNTFQCADNANVILLRGDVQFTGNVIESGRTVNVVSGSPVVTGNDFGDVRFKVYNVATATVENNVINNLAFNDATVPNTVFGDNTLSEDAQAALDAVSAVYVAQIGDVKYTSLADALAAAKTMTGDVVLLRDVTLTEALVIANGADVTLDLGGYTISLEDASGTSACAIRNNGNLTIKGEGKITFNSTTPSANFGYSTSTIFNAGNLVVESGNIENTTNGGASYAIDNTWYTQNVSLTVNGGNISAVKNAVRQVPFSNTYTNTVTINGGTLSGSNAGLQLHNIHSVAYQAKVEINGGTFNGTYAFYTSYNTAQASEYTEIVINDGTFNGYLFLYNGNAGSDSYPMDVAVKGGTFNDGVYIYTADAEDNDVYLPVVSGGTFVENVSYNCAEGFVCEENADGSFGIKYDPTAGNLVQIGDNYYATFEEALAVMKDGDVLVLVGDVEYNTVLTLSANATIDLNGYKLTANGIVLFNDNAQLVDSSACQGLLVVPQGNIVANNHNSKYVPVWTDGGYMIAAVKDQFKAIENTENSFVIDFRPSLGGSKENTVAILENGAADNGLSIYVRVRCYDENGNVTATFNYDATDDLIARVYTNGTTIRFTLKGAGSAHAKYSVSFVVASNTGVLYDSEAVFFENGELK